MIHPHYFKLQIPHQIHAESQSLTVRVMPNESRPATDPDRQTETDRETPVRSAAEKNRAHQ